MSEIYSERSSSYRTGDDGPVEDVTEVSVGQLVGRVTSDVSTLMRQELELAKAEVRQEVKTAGKAAGMLGGAGGAGYFALLFISLALMFLLDTFLPIALAALIVGLLYGIAAAVLFRRGKRDMASVNPKPTQTVETLKEDVQWAKNRP